MTAIEARLLQRLKQLPPSRVAEVVDFVEFLAAREERAAAAARLKEAITRIDDLGLAPFSEDEIEAAARKLITTTTRPSENWKGGPRPLGMGRRPS